MMGLRDIKIKSSYETLAEDPVAMFYVPSLREAVQYDRIAGFFSSTSLALAARGVLGLIENGGKMRMLVSPCLSPLDAEMIRMAADEPWSVIELSMIACLDDLKDTLEDDHVRALGWMLAKGLLEMKIAYVLEDDGDPSGALFHQKVGILRDARGDAISFSGSINETASGWLSNAEEFKVFKSWESGERSYFDSDVAKFEEFWNGKRPYVKVVEPSCLLLERFVKIGEGFDLDRLRLESYVRERKMALASEKISLFPYQAEAVAKWRGNDCRLMLEMATGTGKTRTAIACMNLLLASESKLVCVVATPEVTLTRQWDSEIRALGVEFDQVIYADSSNGGRREWSVGLGRGLSGLAAGRFRSLLVLTTHATASSKDFVSLMGSVTDDTEMCFVGDEVHGLGAPKFRRALLDGYRYRIGLSATPERWFDESGTRLLRNYFGEDAFVFSIRDAQETVNPLTGETFLTPYRYRLMFVSLDDDEMDRYLALTAKIVRLAHADDDDAVERREKLLRDRADITKNAAAKLPLFEELIRSEPVKDTLVFSSPQQIAETCKVLARNRVAAHSFTMAQGTRRKKEFGGLSERQYLIKQFKDGHLQALVAISCLDEGIDIPSAQRAILLSSSTNPREYIQRVGRVIRRFPGKQQAEVIDFAVEPDWSRIHDPDMLRYEIGVFEKEMHRIEDMGSNAENSTDVLFQINKRLERLYGVQ